MVKLYTRHYTIKVLLLNVGEMDAECYEEEQFQLQ
jgi:hypothetical protein